MKKKPATILPRRTTGDMEKFLIRPAVISEKKDLEDLQRRASLTNAGIAMRYSPIPMLLSCRQNRSPLEWCSCWSRMVQSPDLLPYCRGLMEALNSTLCSSSRPCGVVALGGP
jgi:hypothetical protein